MTTAKPSTNGPKRRRSARVEERSRAEAEAQAAAPETPLAKTGKLSSLSESRKARTKVTFQIEIPASSPNKRRKLKQIEENGVQAAISTSPPNKRRKRNAKPCSRLSSKPSKPIKTKTGIFDLPVELVCEIYLDLTLPDALSFASTCRTAQSLFLSNSYRRASSAWPAAFGLLDFQRPGFLPKWKKDTLTEIAIDRINGIPRCSFFEGSTTVYSLQPQPSDSILRPELAQIRRNHSLIEGWVRDHALFKTRIVLNEGRGGLFMGRDSEKSKALPKKTGKFVTKTSSETARIVETVYTIIGLQLQSFAFARFGNVSGTTSKTDFVVDFIPALALTIRQCMEIGIVLKILFHESGISELRAHHHSKETWDRMDPALLDLLRSPLFRTQSLEYAVNQSLAFRDCLIQLYWRKQYGKLKHRSPPQLYLTNGKSTPFRHMFWDENQEFLDTYFDGLTAEYAEPDFVAVEKARAEYEPIVPGDVYEPWLYLTSSKLIPKRAQEFFNSFWPTLSLPKDPDSCEQLFQQVNRVARKWNSSLQGRWPRDKLIAVKVSKDGLITIDHAMDVKPEQRYKNDKSKDARWAILSLNDLKTMRAKHFSAKRLRLEARD